MYSDVIKQATNCDDSEAERIEDFMRDIVFCSTLDWQTLEQLVEAARLAQQAMNLCSKQ